MQAANQQKIIIGVSVLAVVTLLATTLLTAKDFSYKPDTGQQLVNKEAQERSLAEYRQYLKDIQIDPVASSEILNEVVDSEHVSNEIQRDLGVGQPPVSPLVQDNKFVISGETSKEAVSNYATQAVDKINNYYQGMADTWPAVLTNEPDPVLAQQASINAKKLVDDLYKLPVPKSATGLHHVILASAIVHQDMVNNTNNVARGIQPRGAQWRVMPTFLASRTELQNLDTEIQKLTTQYGEIPIGDMASAPGGIIKTAQAQWVVTIAADIPRVLEQFLRTLLGTLVLNFIKDRISSLVALLEKNFVVSNFLYYTDALINTKYGNDYLKKYVPDPDDQAMIKRFLPQFNCGRNNEAQIKQTLRAQAIQYLGFDPSVPLDPSSPKFWSDLGKTADVKGDEPGYQRLYQALAVAAETTAKEASNLEQTSTTGKKSPLDERLQAGITKSVDYISKKLEAALNSVFNIAPANATTGGPGFAVFVVNTVLGIVNQLIIKGTVVKEQVRCIAVPVLNQIIPGDFTPNEGEVTDAQVKGCMQTVAACREMIFASIPKTGAFNSRSTVPYALYSAVPNP